MTGDDDDVDDDGEESRVKRLKKEGKMYDAMEGMFCLEVLDWFLCFLVFVSPLRFGSRWLRF
jgi:hypothetical protein